MIKRLLHIFLVLMIVSLSSIAKSVCGNSLSVAKADPTVFDNASANINMPFDTTKVKKPEPDDKKKIKEIPTAKRQAKPEKLVLTPVIDTLNKGKVKPARQRRPDGLVRPPEIPRRNNN